MTVVLTLMVVGLTMLALVMRDGLQVSSLQERLENLQVTMLDVMNKYGNLKRLEVASQSNNAGDQHLSVVFLPQELHLKNLSMGSLLIILPFCPNLRKLTLKYPLRC